MATGGQFYWPSVGISVAAYGQFFMAANKSFQYRGNGNVVLAHRGFDGHTRSIEARIPIST
jgi:hypothetical protein